MVLKRKISVKDFRTTNVYSIDGSLNQLIWHVENCLFVTLDISPKLYLSSGDYIFNVNKEKTSFSIKCYGYNDTVLLKTNIQVVVLSQKAFDTQTLISKTSSLKNYKPRIILSENINTGLKKICSFSSIKHNHIKISEKINKKTFSGIEEPLNELNNIDNFKTIDQLNDYHHEQRLL